MALEIWPWEGHGFRSFQGAAIVFLGQTTAEGSIRVLQETPDHLGWCAFEADRSWPPAIAFVGGKVTSFPE